MSIATIPENKMDFQGGNNIRIAIAGLAICKFAGAGSTIRFLRHVEKHQLRLKITQIKASDMKPVFDVNYKILETSKTITIAGAEPKTGFEHQPSNYQEHKLKEMMDLRFLHGHELTQIAGTPSNKLTVMTINNCHFYTAKLTDTKFDLVKNDVPIKLEKRFGEILGGYMKVADNAELIITIPGLFASPIKLPAKVGSVKYLYEIDFNNSCFEADDTPCSVSATSESTDFLHIYDILKDEQNPVDRFDLRRLNENAHKAINTGACLPVVEEPSLNG